MHSVYGSNQRQRTLGHQNINFKESLMKKTILHTVFALVVALAFAISAAAEPCPVEFRLHGSGVDKLWRQTTPSAWQDMLPRGWVDKGFHFYARVRERGPHVGINTPSDLESEIRKASNDVPIGGNRREILLNIVNDSGRKMKVIYDYAGKKKPCELVTLTF